ncbi:MAG TPA: hypothetical protein PKA13_17145 [Geminicoccaceae bacterium]|nr:hypothetical protein [Geminicoccus sp.]HMU51504.1 hypothetical protein [Geminicoccaceae bacterium]
MTRNLPLAALAALGLATISLPAEAYIGPGAGISLLGAFWALILAVAGAIGVVVWYPLRNMLRRRQPNRRPAGAPSGMESGKHHPA